MAKKIKKEAKVLDQRMLADGIYDMWIQTEIARTAKSGQFVGLYPTNKATLLPRPISICEIDSAESALRLVYRIAGSGTAEFALYQPDDYIMVLGALGNGYPLDEASGKKVLILGGGIGIPPLLETAKQLYRTDEKSAPTAINAVLGYRDCDTFLSNDFDEYTKLHIATEDGSIGTKGNVLDAVMAEKIEADIIFACGPMPMLKAIKQYSEEKGIRAYLSLEERMACGVGACLGCICKTRDVDGHSHVKNARICTDGPVFDAALLDL